VVPDQGPPLWTTEQPPQGLQTPAEQ